MARKHKPEEIIGKLREVEDCSGAGRDGCGCMPPARGHRAELLPPAQGIWRSEDGLGAADERIGAELERENACLKRLVADLSWTRRSWRRLRGETSEP